MLRNSAENFDIGSVKKLRKLQYWAENTCVHKKYVVELTLKINFRISDLKKPPSPSGQRTKSAMSNKANKADKQEKTSKAKDMKTLGEIAENDPEPPSEITLDVALTLQSWKTAKEAENWVDST